MFIQNRFSVSDPKYKGQHFSDFFSCNHVFNQNSQISGIFNVSLMFYRLKQILVFRAKETVIFLFNAQHIKYMFDSIFKLIIDEVQALGRFFPWFLLDLTAQPITRSYPTE